MLTRLFNQNLPSPTEEQTQTLLVEKELVITSEIISASFEPRFKLYALGSCSGDFYVINQQNYIYSYSQKLSSVPLLKLIPLTNTSSFFSITSYSLFLKHPSNIPRSQRPASFNSFSPRKLLCDAEPDKKQSHLIHWIISSDGTIIPRLASLPYDIIDAAIPQLHPEFMLLLTKTGSIYGFSIEEMAFTDLYIDAFEGKNVTALYSNSNMMFYICHDIIEKLNVKTMEVSKAVSLQIDSGDIFDDTFSSIVDKQGHAHMVKGSKIINSAKIPPESKAIASAFIGDQKWTSIVRSNEGNSIYFNETPKIGLTGEIVIPSILIEYDQPVTRMTPKRVTFVNNYGCFFDLNGNRKEHFLVNLIEPLATFIDHNYNIVTFGKANQAVIFRKGSYFGTFKFEFSLPICVLNEMALCSDQDNTLIIVKLLTGTKVELKAPLLPSPYHEIQKYEGCIDFICDNNQVVRFDIKNKEQFEPEIIENLYVNNPGSDKDVVVWRQFNETYCYIKTVTVQQKKKPPTIEQQLFIGDKYQIGEIFEKNEPNNIVMLDIIDEKGRVNTTEGPFILLVTTKYVSVYVFDSKKSEIKRIRHVLIDNGAILEGTITDWGVLILRTEKVVKLLPLPDPSHQPIATLVLNFQSESDTILETVQRQGARISPQNSAASVDQQLSLDPSVEIPKINPILLPHKGLIIFEQNLVTLYLKEHAMQPPCFDDSALPPLLEPPPVTGFAKLFGKTNSTTTEEADTYFKYKRQRSKTVSAKPVQQPLPDSSPNNQLAGYAPSDAKPEDPMNNAMSNLQETQNRMQELLRMAAERSELMNEMEKKSNRLLESAKEYRRRCRQFR